MVDRKHERKKMLEAVTKHDILEAVVKILTRDGIHGFTMDKVAMEARVAKGTLYIYFKNKDHILESAVETSLAPLLKELYDMFDSDLAPNRKLKNFSLCLFKFFDTHKDLFRILLYDRQQAHLQRTRYQTSRYWAFIEKITGVIDDGIQSGFFLPVDSSKVAIMISEANFAIATHRLRSKSPELIEDDAELIFELLLHGIAAPTYPD